MTKKPTGTDSSKVNVTVYPNLTARRDINSFNLSAGATSVYLRPSDTDHDGMIGTNDVVDFVAFEKRDQ